MKPYFFLCDSDSSQCIQVHLRFLQAGEPFFFSFSFFFFFLAFFFPLLLLSFPFLWMLKISLLSPTSITRYYIYLIFIESHPQDTLKYHLPGCCQRFQKQDHRSTHKLPCSFQCCQSHRQCNHQ